jgi:hypothetical protein
MKQRAQEIVEDDVRPDPSIVLVIVLAEAVAMIGFLMMVAVWLGERSGRI